MSKTLPSNVEKGRGIPDVNVAPVSSYRVITRESQPATRLTLDKVMQIRFSFGFVKDQPRLPIIALQGKRKAEEKEV